MNQIMNESKTGQEVKVESEKNKGRLLIFTGEGKGKTTAAIGLAVRAAGHGQKVFLLQFLKSGRPTGEKKGLLYIPGIELVSGGLGFLPSQRSEAFKAHQETAQKSLELAQEVLQSGKYDLVILDEIGTAMAKGVLSEDQVLEVIRQKKEKTHLVLTGRGISDRLMAQADTVTQMYSLKHGLQQGLKSQKGIEF